MLYPVVSKGFCALSGLILLTACTPKPKPTSGAVNNGVATQGTSTDQQGTPTPGATTTPGTSTESTTPIKPAVLPAGSSETPPKTELADCPQEAAINRISKWWATTEGQMVPSSGTLVKKDNGLSIARVAWQGEDWHVVPVWIGNTFEFGADLSKAKTLTLTYQSAGDFYIQMRPGFGWSGGAQWGVKFPKSADKMTSVTVNLDEASWGQIPGLDPPAAPFAKTIGDVRGFVIVGKVPGDYAFTGMLIDGYTPVCR